MSFEYLANGTGRGWQAVCVHRIRFVGVVVVAALFAAGCDRTSPEESAALARESVMSGDLASAAIHVARAIQAQPADPKLELLRGQIEYLSGDLPRAERTLARAAELGAGAPATLLLADALVQQGQADRAVQTLDGVADADRNGEYWTTRAVALLEAGMTAEVAAALARVPGGGESSRSLLVRSRLAELNGSSDEALRLLDRAVVDSKAWYETGDALMARANLSMRTQRFTAARGDLERAQSLYRDAAALVRSLAADLAIVRVALTLGDLDAASAAASRLAETAPNAPVASYAEGAVAYRQGRYADAVAKLQSAANGMGENAELRTMLGAAHLGAGNVNQAEQQLWSVLATNPADVPAAKLLARVRLQQRRPAEALSILRAIPDDRVDTEVELLRSNASFGSGDREAAVQYAERAVARQPDDEALKLDLARTYFAVGREQDALSILDSLSSGGEALNADILRVFASLRSNEGDLGRALAADLVARFPNQPQAFLAAAMHARTLGDNDVAEQRLRRAIDLDPAAIAPRLALAGALAENDRLPEADQVLRQVLDVEPNNTAALVALSRLSLSRGDVGNADALLTRAVTAAPAARQARFELGLVKIRLNQLDAAIEIAQALTNEAPQEAAGALLLGQARIAQSRFGEAIASFETAFGVEPTLPSLLQLLRAMHAAGRTDEAIRRMRTWLVDHPGDTDARMALADLLQAGGRGTEALEEYDRVLVGARANVVALNNAAWLLRERDPARALALARMAAELAPEHPAVLDTWGWLLVSGGRPEDGVVHLEKAGTLAPDAPDIQYHLAYALAEVQRTDQARTVLDRLLVTDRPFEARADAESLRRRLSTRQPNQFPASDEPKL